MTHLHKWLLAGTVLQALQLGTGAAGAAAVVDGRPVDPGVRRDGVLIAQLSPEEEERRRKLAQPPKAAPEAAPPHRATPSQRAAPPPPPQRVAPPPQERAAPPSPQQRVAPPQQQRVAPPERAAPPPQQQRVAPPPPPERVAPPQQQRVAPPPQVERPRPPAEATPQRPQSQVPPPIAQPQRPQRPEMPPEARPQVAPPSVPVTPPAPDGRRRPPLPGAQPTAPLPGPQVTPPSAPEMPPAPDGRRRPPMPGAQPTAPQSVPQVAPPSAGPQTPPVPVPDGRPRPPIPGAQPTGPQSVPQVTPPPPGPQGFGPRPGGGRPAPAVVPLNPTPPPPPPGQARRNDRRGPNAAVGAAAGFVGGFMAGAALGRIDDIRQQRQVTEQNGVRYYQEPGRTIIRDGDNVYIRHDETERFRDLGIRMRSERRDGMMYSSYVGPGGVTIVSVMTPDGQLLKRYRRYPNGREVIIIDNTYRGGYRAFDPEVVYIVPPPVNMPRERYIVDAEDVDEGAIEEVFRAPPVARVERRYTLDEVRQSHGLRSYMPSVDVDTITFNTGSWEVSYDQANKLATIAQAIKNTLKTNPSEVYLVEGYTDAVGPEEDNLSLSDRRAQSAASILTRSFSVPAENLTTQGYGEQYLKVETEGPEQANRRVTIRRITPLLSGEQAQQ